jgi:hypothetical protein
MRTIRTVTEVDAAPEAVWSVIADFASYHEWNPFVVGIAGEQRLGAALEVRIALGGRTMAFRPQVVDWRPGHSVRWLGKVRARWLFRGEHGLAVEPLPNGRALFVHDELFQGLAVPFLRRLMRKTERGFSAMDVALKRRVESRAAPRFGRAAPQGEDVSAVRGT